MDDSTRCGLPTPARRPAPRPAPAARRRAPIGRDPRSGLAPRLALPILAAALAAGCAVTADENPRLTDAGRPAPDHDADPTLEWPDATPVPEPEPAPAAPRDPVELVLIPAIHLDATGLSAPFTFDVPPGTRTVTLFAEGREGALYVFDRVVDGAGTRWVDPAPAGRVIADADRAMLPFPGPYLSPNRTAWGDVVATAMLPNNPAVTPAPGTWSARLAVSPPLFEGETVDAIVQFEAGPITPRGRLDLHFHFTGAGNWSADSAPGDADFRRMLNVVTVLLRDAGIDVGETSYTDVPVVTRDISAQQDLNRLLRLSTRGDGVSVFFVGRIEDARGGPMAGIAGAVPASAGIAESGANGIAISRQLAMDPRELAMTVTHEIGHALGLFHTVESGTPYVDQLADTPEGDASAGNVMHPTAGAEARRFTAEQGAVMRSSRGVEAMP